jgi:phosphatidylcholine synthase
VPEFDGARLDDIVDYLTYVFAPMFILFWSGSLPAGWGAGVVAAVLLSSGYGFASADAKSEDYFFTGFPSYWNIVAVYLMAGGLPPLVNAIVLLFLVVMVFVRIGYVYPSRTPVLRGPTTALGAAWALMVLVMVWTMPDVSRTLLLGSLYFPVYYTVLSLVLHSRREA